MSIANQFGLDADILGAFVNEPDILESSSTTTMLRKNKEVVYKASINGNSVDAFVTLREASLTRLSLLQQKQASTGRDYWLATGVMQPVKIDIDLVIEGDRISLVDFLHQLTCEAAGQQISTEQFLLSARKIGLNFSEGMPLFFQQFGANYNKFASLVNEFKAAGAEDVLGQIDPAKNAKNRIQAAYQLKPGMPITAFEVGSVDRTKSARFHHDNVGQGFLNLVDAQIEQFTRIVGLRKSAKIKMAQAEVVGVAEDKAKELKASANIDMQMSRQAVSNWAGAQRRIRRTEDGTFKTDNMFDPVNLPCGRLTVVRNDGTSYEADIWSNNNNGGSNMSSTPAPTHAPNTEFEPI
jgi:hypothetical protein